MFIHQPEVEDRKQSLLDDTITIRSSALRDFSYFGVFEDIPNLIEIAKNDSSLAIQHNAAMAISDILSRHRLEKKLTRIQKNKMVQKLQTINPNDVPAVYIALGSLGYDPLIGVLITGVQNSNAEISWAATLGLTRFAISASAIKHEEIKHRVLQALEDEDNDSDVRIKLTYICAAAGYFDALTLVEEYLENDVENEDLLTVRNELLLANKPLRGLWMSTGTDAWEYNPSIDAFTFCLIHDEQAFLKIVSTNQPQVYIREGDWKDWTEYPDLTKRRMWFRPLGSDQRGPAIQIDKRTFYPIPTEAINILLDEEAKLPQGKKEPFWGFLADVLSLRSDIKTSQQWLQIGLLHMRAHRWDATLDSLEIATEYKDVLPDVYYWRGMCLLGLTTHTKNNNTKQQAIEAFELCLDKIKKNSPLFQLCHNEISQLKKGI
jgi:hypothetical protein